MEEVVHESPSPDSIGSTPIMTTPPCLNKENALDNSQVPGHQGSKNTGGKKETCRVLYITNLDFSMNYVAIHMLCKQFGNVERIQIQLDESESRIDSYI